MDAIEPDDGPLHDLVAYSAGSRSPLPAESLCFALIEDAINVLRRRGQTDGKHRSESPDRFLRETRQWIASDAAGWVFSFVRCCRAVGLDPDQVREMIHRAERRPGWIIDGRLRRRQHTLSDAPQAEKRREVLRRHRARKRARRVGQ